jgi:hypothetical protein
MANTPDLPATLGRVGDQRSCAVVPIISRVTKDSAPRSNSQVFVHPLGQSKLAVLSGLLTSLGLALTIEALSTLWRMPPFALAILVGS